MTYFAYLDAFGHIGPYLGRKHPRYNDSPVFGFAGLVLPVSEVRGFGTWFFQRKCHLLHFELERSGEHPAQWERLWMGRGSPHADEARGGARWPLSKNAYALRDIICPRSGPTAIATRLAEG